LIEELNRLLLEKARDQKLISGRKLRIDTTVIESDIHHPTDARLLQDSIKVITRTVKKIKETGAAIRTKFHGRNRSVKKESAKHIKGGQAPHGLKYTGETLPMTPCSLIVLKNTRSYSVKPLRV